MCEWPWCYSITKYDKRVCVLQPAKMGGFSVKKMKPVFQKDLLAMGNTIVRMEQTKLILVVSIVHDQLWYRPICEDSDSWPQILNNIEFVEFF